jgi:hypothetical protein
MFVVDRESYWKFVREQATALGAIGFGPDTLLWHYTDGRGLLGIVSSGAIYSTQVSCLNDSSEVRYGQLLFQRALTDVLAQYGGSDPRVKNFLARYLKIMEDTKAVGSHAPNPFFVACFSADEDSMVNWRAYGGENSYAIAFKARNLFGPNTLAQVSYDKPLHEKLAVEVAQATLRFYEKGLTTIRPDEEATWETEFLAAWDGIIAYLAPLVKDPGFSSEREFRVIHEFTTADLPSMVILQKDTMMTRHIPVTFPLGGEAWVHRLPIEKVMVGPCRHPAVTGISVDTLLRRMGYGTGRVVHTTRPLQKT